MPATKQQDAIKRFNFEKSPLTDSINNFKYEYKIIKTLKIKVKDAILNKP